MKMNLKLFKLSLISGLGVLFLTIVSCSFPYANVEKSIINSLAVNEDYRSITQNSYVGGSAIYAENCSSQLQNGVKLAIRLGRMEEKQNEDGIMILSDIPDSEKYGIIEVTDIDKNSISFNICFYNNNKILSDLHSYCLKLNEICDLDNDGNPDLVYKKPAFPRNEYRNLRYLTFICDEINLYTSMFSILTEQYENNTYPNGLICVNPNGKYVFSKYILNTTNRSSILGIKKGDYVLDALQGSYQTVINDTLYTSKRSLQESDLSEIEEPTEVNYYFSTDMFNEECTPKMLLDILETSSLNISEENCIEELNKLLKDSTLLPRISQKIGYELDDSLRDFLPEINSLEEDALVAFNRMFLADALPDNCPPVVDTYGIDITEVFPYLNINLTQEDFSFNDEDCRAIIKTDGAIATSYSDYQKKQKEITDYFNSYPYKINLLFAATAAKSFKNCTDSEKLKDAILELLVKYPSFSTDQFIFNNTSIFNSEFVKMPDPELKFELALGGRISISASKAEVSVGAAILLKAELADLTYNFGQDHKTVAYSFVNYAKDIFNLSKTFMVGVVPMVTGIRGNYQLPITLSEYNDDSIYQFFVGYTGLIGVDANAGITYGFKKKPWFKLWGKQFYTYSLDVSSYSEGNLRLMNVCYAGAGEIMTKKKTSTKGNGICISFEPSFTLTPNIGVGTSEININLGVPLTAGVGLGIKIPHKSNTSSKPTGYIDCGSSVGLSASLSFTDNYSFTKNIWEYQFPRKTLAEFKF